MKLIIGLGNPGAEYEGTRHNIGFEVVRAVAAASGIVLKKDSFARSFAGRGTVGGGTAMLILPQTFMNLSGLAVAALRRKHTIAPEDVIVVCDDLDLAFGRLRIRPRGSSGGHRGLTSVIEELGTNEVCRLRIGIGCAQAHARQSDMAGRSAQAHARQSDMAGRQDASDYVLSVFNARERAALPGIIEQARECCEVWARHGVVRAMNMYNKSAKEESKEPKNE